jgi:hypothetical protein
MLNNQKKTYFSRLALHLGLLFIFLLAPKLVAYYDLIQAICVLALFVVNIIDARRPAYYIGNVFWLGILIYYFFEVPIARLNIEIHQFLTMYFAMTIFSVIKFRTIFLPVSLVTFLLKFVLTFHMIFILIDSKHLFYTEIKILAAVYLIYTSITLIKGKALEVIKRP